MRFLLLKTRCQTASLAPATWAEGGARVITQGEAIPLRSHNWAGMKPNHFHPLVLYFGNESVEDKVRDPGIGSDHRAEWRPLNGNAKGLPIFGQRRRSAKIGGV